jgi:hypothetical protein
MPASCLSDRREAGAPSRKAAIGDHSWITEAREARRSPRRGCLLHASATGERQARQRPVAPSRKAAISDRSCTRGSPRFGCRLHAAANEGRQVQTCESKATLFVTPLVLSGPYLSLSAAVRRVNGRDRRPDPSRAAPAVTDSDRRQLQDTVDTAKMLQFRKQVHHQSFQSSSFSSGPAALMQA